MDDIVVSRRSEILEEMEEEIQDYFSKLAKIRL